MTVKAQQCACNGGLESQRRSRVVTRDYESQQLVASRNDGLGSSWSGYEWSCAGCESQRDSQSWSRLVLLWFRVVTTRFRLAI
ncbi:hypothetical protein HanXRQr2_Chr16g0748021 [Helianthus annuus]|uniref:Uncharacterized protein n=1 Tax=Helianthus annuus TaxID=4232 RepID=A0A9K3GYN2_HELAN|nr:hypothetical protein HanXRQr2_Chr16g0748021 [Helianthus annuus]